MFYQMNVMFKILSKQGYTMSIFRFSLLIAGCVLFPLFATADASLDSVVDKLQKKYQNMESFQANFTQSYQSQRFSGSTQTESGVVYLRKGGLMKWEYQKPERKIFVSDGLFYFYYVPQDKQVVKSPVDNHNQQSPALFLAGRGNFAKDFKAQWADPRPGTRLVKLIPVKEQPDFEYLIVDVDPVRDLVLRLVVVDSYDNRTEFRFTNIRENPSLPSNFFVFQTPPGTDVILQRREADEN
jgi:outer membrane lipoprotein carrier protein